LISYYQLKDKERRFLSSDKAKFFAVVKRMMGMSLFDGQPIQLNSKQTVVLSASRMTDMPKYYPQELMDAVQQRMNKGVNIHTLVLWTKHPGALLASPLKEFLLELKNGGIQLYLQCTITGMGKLCVGKTRGGVPLLLEPNAPAMMSALKTLSEVVALLGNPRRVRLRIDPIVRILDAAGQQFSNLQFVYPIAKQSSELGITDYSFSLLEKGIHKKVDRRFNSLGLQILALTQQERTRTITWLKNLEQKLCIKMSACCVPGFSESRCIDGLLLQQLHDAGKSTSMYETRSRLMCGCTQSVDIGGWPPRKCFTGCQGVTP